MALSAPDCAIPQDDDGTLNLWQVRGMPQIWFPTKLVAEMAARHLFPGEDPDTRYGRIYFKVFTQR
jgi:hypothetical protein